MQLPAFIDIHTHHTLRQSDVLAIENRHEIFEQKIDKNPYCFGLHPWYLTDVTQQFSSLKEYASQLNVIAIGECGLDKLASTDFALQEAAFSMQIALANEYRKPLIIHCVRAFNEALVLLKAARVPVIFHGFNRNESIADMITKEGYYCSFGKSILNEKSPTAKVLADMPNDRFFLETDDAAISITEIYNAAAALRAISVEHLAQQIHNNFNKVFNQ